MNPTVDVSYREAASTLMPQAVSEYLAVSPWDLERRDNVKEIWQLTNPDEESIDRLMLPLATNYTDFTDRFYDALLTLGRVNDWDANQLLEQILATRADLFFVRLDQATSDGTIPFRQAETTIEAIYKMVRFAAATAAGSRFARGGNLPASAENFLDDDIRLGHTKRGSFVFTVASRLNNRVTMNQPPAGRDADVVGDMAFSRRVMETLARNLETVHNIAVRGKGSRRDLFSIDPYLLESLEEIAKPEDLRFVELSFQWAAAAPRPVVGTDPIKLDHRDVSALSEFREGLISIEAVRVPETENHVTLVGHIVSLARSAADEEGNQTGDVVIMADVGRGRYRQVRVPLSGQDYERAIQAFRSRLPLTISGNLVFVGQRWRLTGNVELDQSS